MQPLPFPSLIHSLTRQAGAVVPHWSPAVGGPVGAVVCRAGHHLVLCCVVWRGVCVWRLSGVVVVWVRGGARRGHTMRTEGKTGCVVRR